MKTIFKKILNLLTMPLRFIAQPWIDEVIIKQVKTQMEFWHKIETTAIENAIACRKQGDFHAVTMHMDQARTARLRCDKEMSKLPYSNKIKNDLNNKPLRENATAQKHRPRS